MKSVSICFILLLGNLAYAEIDATADVAVNTAEEESSPKIAVLSLNGDCLTISDDNSVADCTKEQEELGVQVNQIQDRVISPEVSTQIFKKLVESEGRMAFLEEENEKCFVIQTDGVTYDCTEEEAFALYLMKGQIDNLKSEAKWSMKNLIDPVIFLITGVALVPATVAGGIIAVVGPIALIVGGLVLLAIRYFKDLEYSRYSYLCNLSEYAKIFNLLLNGEALTPSEQVEKLQSAYLKDFPNCLLDELKSVID